jgi:hypothetical protein
MGNPDALLVGKESGEIEFFADSQTTIISVARLEKQTTSALCVAKNREGLKQWAPGLFREGKWADTVKRDEVCKAAAEEIQRKLAGKKGKQEKPTVSEGEVAMVVASNARKTFEAAWWASGANLRGGAPFVSHEAWEATSKEQRENPEEIDKLGPQGSSQVWSVEGGWTAVGGWGAELLSKQSAGSAKPDEQRSKPAGRGAPKPKRG